MRILSGTIIMSVNNTLKLDGIAISSSTIYDSTPISIGCDTCLAFAF